MDRADIATRRSPGRILKRLAGQKIALSQAFYSAGSAVAVLGAAHQLSSSSFTRYSVLILSQTTLVGAARAGIYYPSLVERRYREADRLPVIPILAGLTIGTGLQFAFALAYLGSIAGPSLVAGGTFLVLAYDALRHVQITADRDTSLLSADVARMAVLLLSFGPMLANKGGTVAFALVSAVSVIPGVLLVTGRRQSGARIVVNRSWLRQSATQLAEFGVGQTLVVFPILVIATVAPSPGVGAFRLAQSLIGPMNLLFTAINLRQLTERATWSSSDPREVLRSLRRAQFYSVRLTALAVALTVILLLAVPIVQGLAQAVDPSDLFRAFVANGLLAIGGAMAGPFIVALRALRRSGVVLVSRIGLVSCTFTVYVAVASSSDTYAALLCGAIAAGLLYPIWFLSPAALMSYRSRRLVSVAQ